ncbi:MAG TPA: T9SS type A sorting domain-containing protein, partial [Flavisolibacter sp.]|nr:T9SS type A sorting domain-containing protein [Flavisolibacter sp.]
PNPFHNNTTFNYSMANAGIVRITLFDMNGRIVRTLINGWQSEGTHKLIFDTGNIIPGLYYYRMETGTFRDTKKMTIL